MSGIIGILNFSGASVDQNQFDKLLKQLEFRGPDRKNAWFSGNIALGHSLLATTFEAHHERQPLCFKGKYWLVTDARIDNRDGLIRLLKAEGQDVQNHSTDPELIAHAYDTWGADCTNHLIGDFVFAIWDQSRRRLFCARDHYGIKPFFYSRIGDTLIFSNSINCIRQYPGFSSKLNNQAVLDFLLFGMNLEVGTSIFDQIKRLPPAHQIVLEGEDLKLQKFWSLSPSPDIRYKKSADYIDHFNHLISTAVSDRLRTENTAIEMSGGMDSTSVSAIAKSIIDQSDKLESLRAYAIVYDSLIPDEERYYSEIAASHMGIDITHVSADRYDLFGGDNDIRFHSAEPAGNLYSSLMYDYRDKISSFSRVCLNGQGADEILKGQTLFSMIGKTRPRDILEQLVISIWEYHQCPPLGIRSLLGFGSKPRKIPELPVWIRSDLLKSYDGQGRWEEFWHMSHIDRSFLRSGVVPRFLPNYYWAQYVESYDPEMTRATIEYRWPFLDIRLIQELLAFPPLPWFNDKFILRESMRGQLPETLRKRPKSPLQGHPYLEQVKQGRMVWSGYNNENTRLNEFVDINLLDFPMENVLDIDKLFLNFRAISLYNWLSVE